MNDFNIFAVLIFIVAIAGIIGLVVYKAHKDKKGITIEEFISTYYNNLINVLQDVVTLLTINIESFPDKESYEKAIITTTIDKLNENCEEFGIDATIFKLIDKEIFANMLYNLLHKEEVMVFTRTVPMSVASVKPELYDDEVIDAINMMTPAEDIAEETEETTPTAESAE